MMSTFDGALLVRTVGLGGISSHPYCDLRPVAAFVCKILKLNPISRPKGCGGLAPVEGNGCNPTPPHAHKKFPRRDLLNIQVEFKCIQVARWSAQRRPRGGGLATAARALRRNPRPHAEILAKRIRQNFFLSTNRGRRAGGGRGVKSLQPSGLLPHGAARADFFSWRRCFDYSNAIKQFKHPKDQALASRRLGAGRQNRGFIFRWALRAISGAWKNVAKFRVGGGGRWMTGQRIGGSA